MPYRLLAMFWTFRLPLALLAALGAAATAVPAFAQQDALEATDDDSEEDSPYSELLRSEDRTSRMTAERYLTLVKLQEWNDSTGKSRVVAKYVEHDPNMAWVKILAVRGRGEDRVSKEITVPLARLSKTCQSRVRQIDTLQKKLDGLLAGAEGTDALGGVGDAGAPMQDERGIEPPANGREAAVASSATGYQPSVPPRRPLPPRPGEPGFDPDPLGFAEVPIESPPPVIGAENAPLP
jgi:hypothetical protein